MEYSIRICKFEYCMNNVFWFIVVFLFVVLLFQQIGCIVVENEFLALFFGLWCGVLELEFNLVIFNFDGELLLEKFNLEFEEVINGELFFNFEVVYINDIDFYIELINGVEWFWVDDIIIGLDWFIVKDIIVINFLVYDFCIEVIYEEDVMEGEWIVNNWGEDYCIFFKGYYGKGYCFIMLCKMFKMDLSGKWVVIFGVEGGESEQYFVVVELKQDGNVLIGIFMIEMGDYCFLEGSVQADKVYFSCFDGAYVFMFEVWIREDGSFLGFFCFGKYF